MKHNHARLVLMALFLALASSALASTAWYVNGVSGSDSNDCKTPATACKTIGHAISLASSGDSIMVAAATYTEHLSIGFNLAITGSGANTTVIDGGVGGTVVTISGGTGVNVSLSRVTVRNGAGFRGGGVFNGGTLTINNSVIKRNAAVPTKYGSGGGVFSNGILIINNSTIRGNSAGLAGGGIVSRTLTINNSTISGNSAPLGGGVFSNGILMINNSTISGNSAANGGGILNNGGTLTISSSTISGNSATIGGGISGTATLKNSIVANSSSGGNCSGTITSHGHNLSSDDTCNFNNTGDLNNTDPILGPLQNNGGPTQTQALLSGSPAIDAGKPSGCTDGLGHLLTTDQRGKPRPDTEDTGGCDMGAYERQSD